MNELLIFEKAVFLIMKWK